MNKAVTVLREGGDVWRARRCDTVCEQEHACAYLLFMDQLCTYLAVPNLQISVIEEEKTFEDCNVLVIIYLS